MSTPTPSLGRAAVGTRGVRILGTGSAFPKRVVTNADLEKVMDTSDEWIVQRSGIHERRHHDAAAGENTSKLATEAVQAALAASKLAPTDLDLILVGTMTPECPTPSVACNVAHRIGARQIGAMDLNAACSGFVFSLNLAHDLIRGGAYRTVAVVGADCVTRHCDMTTYGRSVSVLFGDAAGAVIVQGTDDPAKGILAQAMHSDGGGGRHLFIPSHMSDFPEGIVGEQRQLNCIQMNGQAVFKFAVTTFPKLIEQTLDMANIRAEDVDHYVCHQSNLRILDAAIERFGLGADKLHINIGKYGNTVGASVPLVLDDLAKAGRLKPGQKVMFLAFGAGLTWGSSLWQT